MLSLDLRLLHLPLRSSTVYLVRGMPSLASRLRFKQAPASQPYQVAASELKAMYIVSVSEYETQLG